VVLAGEAVLGRWRTGLGMVMACWRSIVGEEGGAGAVVAWKRRLRAGRCGGVLLLQVRHGQQLQRPAVQRR
jgi:hypothetical protein